MANFMHSDVLMITVVLILLMMSLLLSFMPANSKQKGIARHEDNIRYFLITKILKNNVGYMMYLKYGNTVYKLPISSEDLPARIGPGSVIPMYMTSQGPRMLKREYLEKFI